MFVDNLGWIAIYATLQRKILVKKLQKKKLSQDLNLVTETQLN